MEKLARQISPLTVSGLTKQYGSARGIEDVSFALTSGETFGFLGPNGAGKSTTIRTILGFLSPSSGSVAIFGKPPSVDSRQAIGYLSGDFIAYEHLTGKAFLDYLASLSHDVDDDYVQHLVEQLDATLDRPIRDLSKGNKQKIGIIQAMMHRPKLLLFDEPTSGLDPLIKQAFYELLETTKATHGTTIFFSSHDLAEVHKISDRAGFIRAGKLIGIEDIANTSHLRARRFVITTATKPSNTTLAKLKSLADVTVDGYTITCVVSGSMREFLSAVSLLEVTDFREQALSLEEVFMHYYEKEGNA